MDSSATSACFPVARSLAFLRPLRESGCDALSIDAFLLRSRSPETAFAGGSQLSSPGNLFKVLNFDRPKGFLTAVNADPRRGLAPRGAGEDPSWVVLAFEG